MFVEEKPQGEITEAPAKVLKLSEAIRIGAAQYPQCCDGCYFIDGTACVWGAAAIGFGAHGTDYDINDAASTLHSSSFTGKAHFAFRNAHGYSIMEANDRHGWSREEVADWLEAQGY